MSRFFIYRPIFATVISIIIMIAGVVSFLHDRDGESGDVAVLFLECFKRLPGGDSFGVGDELRKSGVVGKFDAEAAEDAVLVFAIADRAVVDRDFEFLFGPGNHGLTWYDPRRTRAFHHGEFSEAIASFF